MDAIVFDEECQTLLNPYSPRLLMRNSFPLTHVFNGISFSPPKRYQSFSSFSTISRRPSLVNASTMTSQSSTSTASSYTQCSSSSSATYCSTSSQYEYQPSFENKEIQTCVCSSTQGVQATTVTSSQSSQCQTEMNSEGIQVCPVPVITISTSAGTEDMHRDLKKREVKIEIHQFVKNILSTVVDDLSKESTAIAEEVSSPRSIDDEAESENCIETEHTLLPKCEEDGYELVCAEEAEIPPSH